MRKPYLLTDGEKYFDKWFYAQSKREQERLREAGCRPHIEETSPDTVYPVIEDHKMWSSGRVDDTRVESTRFISEEDLKVRLNKLFIILERYTDGFTALNMIFIRTVLGCDTGTNLAKLAKEFGITKQAICWRARNINRALSAVADDLVTVKQKVRRPKKRQKLRKSRGNPPKESFNHRGIHRAASHPGVSAQVSTRKPKGADR